MKPNIMHSYDQGKNSHGEMRRNRPTLAGYELELQMHSRGLLGIPQCARTPTPCMATNHQTQRKVNLRVARGMAHFKPALTVLILITPDGTVLRLLHTTTATMAREVREVKARAKARCSIVTRVKDL